MLILIVPDVFLHVVTNRIEQLGHKAGFVLLITGYDVPGIVQFSGTKMSINAWNFVLYTSPM